MNGGYSQSMDTIPSFLAEYILLGLFTLVPISLVDLFRYMNPKMHALAFPISRKPFPNLDQVRARDNADWFSLTLCVSLHKLQEILSGGGGSR